MSMNIAELDAKTRDELLEMAKGLGITGVGQLKKQDLVLRLLQASAELQGNIFRGGVLEIMDEGIVIADNHENRSNLKADTIILAVRLEPDRKLVKALQDKLPEVYAIGDCVEPRIVLNAISEGFRTARLI